ncbi:hypothetical protein ABHN05_10505 [Brevibacillus laterosporus]|uniref:hypothetical protein n=1 Tax=Brevibacillus laterosporus TaxID=1465 RepID=UPI003D23D45B
MSPSYLNVVNPIHNQQVIIRLQLALPLFGPKMILNQIVGMYHLAIAGVAVTTPEVVILEVVDQIKPRKEGNKHQVQHLLR